MTLQNPTIWKTLHFSRPESIQQKDMLEYLSHLSPRQRTELLGELYSRMEMWRNEQVLTEVAR